MKALQLAYPAARRSATTYTLHGKTIPEPYDYLEDPGNQETKDFVTAQNGLFESYMASSADLRTKIYERVSAMQNYARTGNPSLHGKHYYYRHNSGLQNQSVLMRTDSLEAGAAGTVFLDPNTLSPDGTTALKAHGWSENEELFAYCLSDKGSDWEYIRVRNAKTGEDLLDNVQWAKFTGVSWWKSEGFFYTRYPALGEDVDKGAETDSARDAFICFHKVGTAQEEDITILQIPEHPLWNLNAEVSDCDHYVIVTVSDGCEPNNRIWVAPLPDTVDALKAQPLVFNKIVDEFVADYGYLGNDGETFYFTCTKNAPRKKVISINVATGQETDLIAEQASLLNYAALAKNTLLLVYLEDVKDVVYYCSLSDLKPRKLALPIGTILSLFANRKKDFVSFTISSFLLPGRSFVLDINDPEGSLKVFKDDTVEGLEPSDYVTEQVFYNGEDGARIPMFIVHRKGELTSNSPVLLYGYGGFNISLTPFFSAARLVLLRNLGGVLAIPNIRGGGEYGQAWHDAGRRANKQNCFSDFIAAAKYLHANKIGSPATTAIMGGSNGGLLVAACANQAPEELGCVVCQVGVLDMFKFHKFTIGHAWISDYGDPDKEEDFKVVEKYSPIHNVRAGAKYSPILVVTGDHDDRVVPLHSLKYVATLQHTNPELGGPFLARIEVAAGHGAGKPVSKIVRESADMYAFIAKSIGAKWTD